jgi:hypothetical protein
MVSSERIDAAALNQCMLARVGHEYKNRVFGSGNKALVDSGATVPSLSRTVDRFRRSYSRARV